MSRCVVVDKPSGMTSHDVVGRVRRALGTRQVGHAGTLDPMATGVLVVLVGEATKLSSYVTLDDKIYEASIALGQDTTSHDREGAMVRERPIPDDVRDDLGAIARALAKEPSAELDAARPIARALAAERARVAQTPPIVSAIHVDGKRSHALARAGESPVLAPRPIRVHELTLLRGDARAATLDVRVSVSKGYYVRALARDLGEALGTGAYLTALRRVASGTFTLEDAVALPDVATSPRRIDLVELARRTFGVASLTEDGAARAKVGKTLDATHFDATRLDAAPRAPCLWLGPDGAPVAIGAASDDGWRVLRGITA